MKRFTTLLASSVLLLAACKQNPFPETGRIVHKEPEKPIPVVPPLVLDVPDSSEVVEGQALEILLTASVPAPGKPLISLTGLPPGATFDQDKMKITWKPDFTAANDPRDQAVILKTYPLHFMLSSSEDPVTITQRSSLIVVRDVPQPMTMNIAATPKEIKEGLVHEQEIEITSADFPEGPFNLQIKNLPVSATVMRDLTKLNKFKISYSPSFRDVNFLNSGGSSWQDYIDRPMEVTAFGPRGASVALPLTWRIKDAREKAIVLAPTTLKQGLNVAFTVSSEDPNGEEAPSLSINPRPSFGLAELRIVESNPGVPARGVNPSTVGSLRWTQIPPSMIGKTGEITIRSCVKKNVWAKDLCIDKKVSVTFENEQHAPPVIDRAQYPLGVVKYIRENDKQSIAIPVKDGEFGAAPDVKVTPVSDEVAYKAGKLEITAKKAGLKQFSVVATSVFGVVQSESFLLEVLPWSWSPVVLFGESPTNAEVKATVGYFESTQVANPSLQLDDPRLLVLRNTAYISTSALTDAQTTASLEKQLAGAGIKSLVVSSPLAGKLEGSVKAKLDEFKVKVENRLTDLTGYTLEFDAASGLQAPSDVLKLSGKLSLESATPAPLTLGDADKCKPILLLKKASEPDLIVAAKCGAAGELVVAGIEFGDIQTAPADNRLIKEWFKKLVAQ